MSVRPTVLRHEWPAFLAGALTLGMDVVYILLLSAEGEGDLDRVRTRLIATSLAAASAASFGGWLVGDPRLRLGLLNAASLTMLAWGFLGMFSIGLPVFVAGVVLLVSVGRTAQQVPLAEAYAITLVTGVAALVLAGSIVATSA
jgi:hypothetical protein